MAKRGSEAKAIVNLKRTGVTWMVGWLTDVAFYGLTQGFP